MCNSPKRVRLKPLTKEDFTNGGDQEFVVLYQGMYLLATRSKVFDMCVIVQHAKTFYNRQFSLNSDEAIIYKILGAK